MTRRGVITLLSACAASLMLGGCDWIPSYDTLRYRITVEVDTPGGVKTGSSVIESTITNGKSWGDASGISYALKGEAVAVDLPGRTLFALLQGAATSDAAAYHAMLLTNALRHGAIAVPAFARNYGGVDHGVYWQEQRRAARTNRPRIALPVADYPLLVTFGDIRDPKSVMRVDPADLAVKLGPGVRLKSITLQVTDDPVTTGIEKRLSWLAGLHGSYLDGSTIGNSSNNGIHGGYFSSELFK